MGKTQFDIGEIRSERVSLACGLTDMKWVNESYPLTNIEWTSRNITGHHEKVRVTPQHEENMEEK